MLTSNTISCAASAVTLDVSDLCVSDDPCAELVTARLGSCMVLLAHDPRRRSGGMVRFMLPDSAVNPHKAKTRPTMFADTGVPLLVQSMLALGCELGDLTFKAVGGGAIRAEGAFAIGQRNVEALRQVCHQQGLTISAEQTGGAGSSTVRLEVGSGKVTVVSQRKESQL